MKKKTIDLLLILSIIACAVLIFVLIKMVNDVESDEPIKAIGSSKVVTTIDMNEYEEIISAEVEEPQSPASTLTHDDMALLFDDRIDEIIAGIPNKLKVNFNKIEYVDDVQRKYESNVVAYARADEGAIYWISVSAINDYTIAHEMGHLWERYYGIHTDPNLIEAYYEEWADLEFYGSKNIHEAIAETVAYLHVGHQSKLSHAPMFTSIIQSYLDSQE